MQSTIAPRLRQPALSYWRRFTTGSTNRQVLRAAITIGVLTSVAKLASVAKELLVARRFGTGATIEAYLMALLIPMLTVGVISSSFSLALIPTYITVREKEGKEEAQRLLSGVTVWSLILLVLTTIVVLATARLYLPWLASGFDQKKLDLTFRLLLVLSPIIVLNGVANIWGAILNAGERFALVALAPIITPSVTLFVLLVVIRYSIEALPVGMVCGALLEMLLLGLALKLRGISLRPSWHGFGPHLREVGKQFGPRVGASLLRGGSGVVDRALAATLPKGVAVLNYGNRISITLLSVAGAALGSAITPYYSKMITHRDWPGVQHTLKRYLLLLILASVPVVVIIFIFAAPIVQLVFQRGSFRARDTQLVAHVQALYALQIPFYLCNVLVVRLLSALLATRVTMWAAAINLALNIVLDVLFIRVMGVSGIALATSCASLVTLCFVSYHAVKILRVRTRSHPPDAGAEAREVSG